MKFVLTKKKKKKKELTKTKTSSLVVQTRNDRIGSLHFKLIEKYLLFGWNFKLLYLMVYIKTKVNVGTFFKIFK
jgi:hypothetical protein